MGKRQMNIINRRCLRAGTSRQVLLLRSRLQEDSENRIVIDTAANAFINAASGPHYELRSLKSRTECVLQAKKVE